jgi:hypothetical protein
MTVPTRTSANTNASADINDLQTQITSNTSNVTSLKNEQPNAPYNMIIDGDFNKWRIATTISADGYSADMWYFDLGAATGSFFRNSHATSNSKPVYATMQITGSGSATSIYQTLDGNKFSGKTISVFLELKDSGAPTGLSIDILSTGVEGLIVSSSAITGFTGDWKWFRKDIVVPTYDADTEFKIINDAIETYQVSINKVRVIEKPDNLPDDTIPEWIKQDEDPLKTIDLINYNVVESFGSSPSAPYENDSHRHLRTIQVVLGGNAYVADDIITVRAPYAMTLSEVKLGVATAPTGASLDVDVRYHATDPTSATTILSSDVSIAASAYSGTATPSTTAIAKGGFFVIDVNQIGSTLPGTGLIIEIKE